MVPASIPGENWLGSFRPEIFWKPLSCGWAPGSCCLDRRLKKPIAAVGKNVLLCCVIVPEVCGGSEKGSSPPRAAALLEPLPMLLLRLYQRRKYNSKRRMNAKPATDPTTLPAITPADVWSD